MQWDPEEIPLEALMQRVRRLQAAMAAGGLDAILLYTNFIRSAAVSYMTAFSPYWADGVLMVPRTGEPLFATTLSKRVGSWIQTVKPVGDVVTSPTPGTVLGKRMAEAGAHRIGVLELDAFPSGLFAELSAASPGAEFVDASDVFASARAVLDDVERRLVKRADAIAQEALDRLTLDASSNVGSVVGAVERDARLQGAEEVYVAIAPDLDADRRFLRLSGDRPLGHRFAVRATVAYKGSWVRHTRTYSRDDADRLAIARADAWFENFLSNSNTGENLREAVKGLSRGRLSAWMVEAPVGTHPLMAVASSDMTSAAVPAPYAVITVALTIDGVPWCGAGLAGTPVSDTK
jgi:hypothetical protein